MAQFKQYNELTGMYVSESDLPEFTDGIKNTEVPLRAKTLEVSTMVFDTNIQDWRELTPEQWREHLNKVTPEQPSDVDEFMATTATAIADLTKSNMALMATIAKQSKKLDALEKRILILEPKGDA